LNLRLVRQTGFIFSIIFIFASITAFSQVEPQVKPPAGTLPVKNDTSGLEKPDTLSQTSTPQDTAKTPPPKSDIETTINYNARDSIRASIDGKTIWLYGDAKIVYGAIELEAEEIVIDYANHTIAAHGVRDSTGMRVGYPIFKNGSEIYETKGITYNFKTRRARIKEIVTEQGEGILVAQSAFKNEKNEIFSIDNSYTTCNLEKPHFRIRATKTKAIPDDKIVSGPFYLEFNGIPIPAGFLFGMFPAQRESSSGIIFPSYGDERRRGFNLRRGGYFFDINEYVKLSLTGDIYSKGSHALYVNTNYMKRYAYNGGFNFSYSKNRSVDNIEDRSATNDFAVTWSHSPQTKGTGRFSASVNAATSTFNKNNNLMSGAVNEFATRGIGQISRKLSSNISYSKRFSGTPFSMGINLSHNQDLVTGLVDLPLPNITLNMTNIYPFQKKGKTGPLDNFSIGYSMAATNRITNNLGRITPGAKTDSIAPFVIDNLDYFIKHGRKGVRHTIPLAYSFKAFKHFTVSPNINYTERWYFEKQTWKFHNDSTDLKVVADTVDQFNRVSNYSFSTSMNTRIFGMYFFKNPNSRVKAIRHILSPSVGVSYEPDFSKNTEYFQEFTERSTGKTVYQSRHLNSVYGGSTYGKSGSVNFGLGNNLEMKVKNSKDTVERKVMLLNSLSLGSSYNLMADSFNLAPVGIQANTSILDNKINITLASSLDPYVYRVGSDGVERRTNIYSWNGARSFGRINQATLGFNTNLNPAARKKEQTTREKVAQSDLPEHEKQEIIQNPNAYVDFDIPWSLNIAYSLTYTRPLTLSPRFVQTIQLSGTLALSEKWQARYNTGFDFEKKDFTITNVGITRDLHCWEMALNWVPFGYFQEYNFTIRVKASILKDLKLERRKPFMDNLGASD